MSIDMINNLSQSNKLKLINYMEGLPYDIKNYVKGRINDDNFDPSLFRGNKRIIHNLATISRYMKKNKIEWTDNPNESFYQSEYCSVLNKITNKNLKIDNFIRQRLEKLVDMDFYDSDTVIKVELAIADLISEMKNLNSYTIQEICHLINIDIMGYKYKSYDFYNYIMYSEDLQLSEKDYSHMFNLYSMINHTITSDESEVIEHDLSILLFIYFNDIGVNKVLNKYGFFDRFEVEMKMLGKSENFISSVKNKIAELGNQNLKISDLSYGIVNYKKISDRLYTPDKADISQQENPNIKEVGGYIFTFKNINSFDNDEINKLSVKLRGIPKNEITHFLNGLDITQITFDLSENDFGHLKNINGLYIGTIYDEFDKSMKYIGYYEGMFYLLFKDRFHSRKVYGISVDKIFNNGNELSRNILTIEESKQLNYSYINEY